MITKDMLDDMDRNARAYGWEIGKGKPLTTEMEMSPDNPFTDKNWKDNVVAPDEEEQDKEPSDLIERDSRGRGIHVRSDCWCGHHHAMGDFL